MNPIMAGPRKGESVSFSEHSTERYPWYVTGSIDWPVVRALLLAVTPLQSESGNWRQSITLDKQKALDVWYADVTYGPVQPPDPATWQWEYDASPESIHVTCAKELLHAPYCATGFTAPTDVACTCAIGVSKNGLEGADILSSTTSWTEQHQMWATAVPFGYGDMLSNLEAMTNQGSFRGYDAGRVLFLGGNIKRSSKDPEWMDANFKFRLDKQRTLTYPGIPDAITVPPHAIVDLFVQEAVETASNLLLPKLQMVRVLRAYDAGDFSVLGIGS